MTVPTQVWRESHDEPAHGGEGITRTEDPSAGFYWVEVLMRGQAPLFTSIRAQTPDQAEMFARNRHPQALATRLMEVAA